MVLPDEVHDSGDLSGKLSFYRTSRSVNIRKIFSED